MWFIAAEDIITAYARSTAAAWLTGHGLAEKYAISYAAAYRLKKQLLDDLSNPSGLIGPSICVRNVPLPPNAESSETYLNAWLIEQMMTMRRR
ncbi:hypothetical protein [Sulfitobacter dubius]|jgi:hypothetical protein|uniref:hypothetical protein n=1 Tax=Sulfitobacter dubius TaxID=218673 RepID=UPI0026B117BA|tara:strand:- start:278 stop:556 length:279 start_codon:yes stop_codon:yes gene_type:complete